MVSGDQAVGPEMKRLVGRIETAAVQQAIGFYAATMMHPEAAQRLIREGVKRRSNVNATILAPDRNAINRRPVAPRCHTVGLLLFLALITYGGVRTHGTTTTPAPATNLVRLYLTVMAGEWMLVFYVWQGIRRRGVALRELIGGDWSDASAFGRNFAITMLFWFVWEGSARAMHLLLGPSDTANVTAMLPRSSIQIALWCLVSCTAGF